MKVLKFVVFILTDGNLTDGKGLTAGVLAQQRWLLTRAHPGAYLTTRLCSVMGASQTIP